MEFSKTYYETVLVGVIFPPHMLDFGVDRLVRDQSHILKLQLVCYLGASFKNRINGGILCRRCISDREIANS